MKTDADYKESFKQIEIARQAILDALKVRRTLGDKSVIPATDTHRFHHPQPHYFCGCGVMACPICKTGQLHYSRSSYNGHVHGSCTNNDCVNWME